MLPQLLFDIAKCKNFLSLILVTQNNHPCNKIVDFQRANGSVNLIDFQLPEPWSGDIINAPILFISSNPGFSDLELYPTLKWPDPMIADFFMNRFKDRGIKYSWVYNSTILLKNGKRGKSVHYWTSVKNRATELLGRTAIPGADYCNTELVHCKSSGEIGVRDALPECTNRFLDGSMVTGLSGAKIIIGIGDFVRKYFNNSNSCFGIPIIYLPHPAAGKPKTLKNNYGEDEIRNLRETLLKEKKRNLKIPYSDIKLPSDEEVKAFIESQILALQNSNL